MKKLAIFLSLGIFFSGGLALAGNCNEIDFGSASVCIDIDKQGDTYELETEIDGAGSSYSLKCDILLPNNELWDVGACDGEFEYDDEDERRVKLYVKLDNDYKTVEWTYDFDDGEWTSSSNSDDVSDFDIEVNEDEPATDEYIDVTVTSLDEDNDNVDRDGTVDFDIEEKRNGSRRDAYQDDYYLRYDYYNFDNDDNVEIENLIKFDADGTYRIKVTDDQDSRVYAYSDTIDVGDGGSSSNDLDKFEFDVEDDNPDSDEWITVNIEAQDYDDYKIDDYDEEVVLRFEYKNGSSWYDADENDLEIKSDDFNDDEYDLNYNGELEVDFEDGELEFEVRFDNDDEYRITVEDEGENIDDDQEFDVGSSSSNGDLDKFEFDVEDDNPDSDEWITVNIEAQDYDDDKMNDYDEEVILRFEYKNGSSWYDADENDLEIRSSDFNDDEYDLNYNGELEVDFEYGELEFEVRFNNEDEYRITVEDEQENIDDDQEFDVGGYGGSSNGDVDEFDVTTDPDDPDEDERIDITVEAVDNDGDTVEDYDEDIVFTIEYRTSSSSYWREASTSYYEINDTDDWDQDYENGIEFDSDWDGENEFNNFIRFNREYQFRITVENDYDSDIYGYDYADVGGNGISNSEVDTFEVDVNDDEPEENDYIDLEVRAFDDDEDLIEWDGTIEFKILEKRGSSRYTANSSNYYTTHSDFDFDDEDEIEIDNFIKFKDTGEFKIKVIDEDDDNVYAYSPTIEVGGGSDTDGFTSSELNDVEKVYDQFPSVIEYLQDEYRVIKNDDDRQEMADELYDNMEDVLDDESNREFEDYEDFYDAFTDRFSETLQIIQ